jgi:antirestriction protein ArdC
MSSIKVYEIVTDKILAALEQGTVPWHKPWQAGLPQNAITHRRYSGINAILLGMTTYSDPRWLTYKQASEHGGQVRKGEKSTLVVFWKTNTVNQEAENGEVSEKVIPILRYYLVFNVEQCDGLNLPKLEARQIDAIAEAEAIVAGMSQPPSISYDGGSQAYYLPSTDSVHLPKLANFDSSEEYYSTLFHELCHSTGHTSRLNRFSQSEPSELKSHNYSKEELVAEFGDVFLCAHAGIQTTLDNSASYINGWLRVLKNDVKLAVIAASQGQKAADYILGTSEKAE